MEIYCVDLHHIYYHTNIVVTALFLLLNREGHVLCLLKLFQSFCNSLSM